MKILGTTSDDDYITNGAVVGGHVANLTTREFLQLLSWLAEDGRGQRNRRCALGAR